VVVVSEPTYREEIAVDGPVSASARLWRPPSRIALAAWGGLVAGVIAAFYVDLPAVAAWIVGIAVAAVVYGWPLSSTRRAPIVVTVEPDALVVRQASKTTRVPLSSVRRARVLVAAGERRHLHGWGLSWGHAGRRVWDLPVSGLGMVRVERDHRGLDVDVASARPDALVAALAEAATAGEHAVSPVSGSRSDG
jgi:hypothetical protein